MIADMVLCEDDIILDCGYGVFNLSQGNQKMSRKQFKLLLKEDKLNYDGTQLDGDFFIISKLKRV